MNNKYIAPSINVTKVEAENLLAALSNEATKDAQGNTVDTGLEDKTGTVDTGVEADGKKDNGYGWDTWE